MTIENNNDFYNRFKHNKKRNIGLLSEFFSRYMALAAIERREQDMDKAKKLWEKHLSPNSELYKELSLFNALLETSLKNKEIGYSLLRKVQIECQKQNQTKLDQEKISLIEDVRASLKDHAFFEREVPNYKTFASIQTLLNAWRGIGIKGSVADISLLEENILEHILTDKSSNKKLLSEETLGMTQEDVDGITVKIMHEKVNNKFSSLLNDEQKNILNSYIFSSASIESKKGFVCLLKEVKEKSLSYIDNSFDSYDANMRKKLNEIKSLINTKYATVENYNDDLVAFYMSVSKLKEELLSKDEKETQGIL